MTASPMPTTEQLLPPPIRLCDSSHGFLAGCHTQRPRGYPGRHPCSAGGWSSSPGLLLHLTATTAMGPQCHSFFGLDLLPPLKAVLFTKPRLLWPASASSSFFHLPVLDTFSAAWLLSLQQLLGVLQLMGHCCGDSQPREWPKPMAQTFAEASWAT